MSVARSEFLASLDGIKEAINLESLAQGATGANIPPGIFILRRGILIAGLIALESFVRDRTVEVVRVLERWPKAYEDLPEKLRHAARLNALSHLQQFARVLKRQGDDFEGELRIELEKMSSGHGRVQQFTKYIAGDYTGNISDTSMKELLSSLQVQECWITFRNFASETGFGVPSVQEIVKNTVRKRHRSAHSAGYIPTASEISDLRSDLLCIAMCVDVAISCSMEQAIAVPDEWASGNTQWKDSLQLYIAKPCPRGLRVTKYGRDRALYVCSTAIEARTRVPRPAAGSIAVLVQQDESGRPSYWEIL